MQPASARSVRFVRAVLQRGEASARGGLFRAGAASLGPADVAELIAAGILVGDHERCRPSGLAAGWLGRAAVARDSAFAAQHRAEVRRADGTTINLGESPLARLACAGPGEAGPYLDPHQVEAGERVRRLCERARLQPRVTMSYSAAHTAGTAGSVHASELSDMTADARRRLSEIPRVLPPDCAGVVLDVCGLLKGLQLVESERGWPRRSAKLVLRIGLDQLARHYGLLPAAVGPEARRPRHWLDEGARPHRFE